MGFKGSVESFSLADVFQNLSMNQQTGTLRIIADSNEEKHVFFMEGQARYLSRGPRKLLLPPPVFVARYLAQRAQLDAALEWQQRHHLDTIGAALVEQGIITDEQLREIVKHQLREELLDLFSWKKASFEFKEGPLPDDLFADQLANQNLNLPVSHLIMEAARRVDEWARICQQVPSFNEIYCMDLAARQAFEKGEMDLDIIEKRVASLIDGGRDVNDLIDDSWLFKFEVISALAGFRQSSIIRSATAAELSLAEQEYLRQNLPKRRIKILERILELSGENQSVRKSLAELLARELQVEKACVHYDALIDSERQSGHEDAAMELCRHILAISPKHGKAHEQLAVMYAQKGQKGEAFIHYRELFEILREQNLPQEARNAALSALDCDPTRVDLRNSLIELLIANQQKDSAAQQLELLGDQVVKIGNTKLAADHYRRAMQFRSNNKQLKRKLADVMLTKEDLRARKRRKIGIIISMIVVLLLIGGIFLLERKNLAQWEDAKRIAQPLLNRGREDLEAERFPEAIEKFKQSNDVLQPLLKLFSPIKRYDQLARNLIGEGNRGIQEIDQKITERAEIGLQRGKTDLNMGQEALKDLRIYDAKKSFERVLSNPLSSEEQKLAAKTDSEKTQRLIAQLEEGARKLQRNPNAEWATIEEEIAWKKTYIETFKTNPELLDINKILLPFHIQPEINSANVFLDGKTYGTVKKTGKPSDNIARYPFLGAHRLEFKSIGYKSVTINISEQSAPIYILKMERAPSARIELSLPNGVTLTGDAASDGEVFYVGTSEGSLLQIGHQPVPILRRYDFTNVGLNREVYGSPFILKDTPKGDLIIYCTKAGDCVGLRVVENGFEKVWAVKGDPANPLTAKPVMLKPALLSGRAVCALPMNRKLMMIECETGAMARSLDVRQTITASPLLIENRAIIVVGCNDGNLYGITLDNDIARQWNSNAQAAAIRGRPMLLPSEDSLIAGADDGALYFFNAKTIGKSYKIGEVKLKGAIVSEPLLLKKQLYVGAALTTQEGFWSIDLSRRKEQWHSQDLEGGVLTSPVALEKRIYFVTNSARLYALDSEKGSLCWVYQLSANDKSFFCSPLIINRRIYAFSDSGRILGFDELPDE